MKKLVFLHGSGSDKNAYGDLMHEVIEFWDGGFRLPEGEY